MRSVLSGGSGVQTHQANGLEQRVRGLLEHVDRLEEQKTQLLAEADATAALAARHNARLRVGWPAVLAGGGIAAVGAVLQSFVPGPLGLIVVGVGTLSIVTGGIVGVNSGMALQEAQITGRGLRDRVDITVNAKTQAHCDIRMARMQLNATRREEQRLLQDLAQPPATVAGTIQMEAIVVRIGDLAVPRRVDPSA
jgi:outer membrane murein-binding lipoprotein Lpp